MKIKKGFVMRSICGQNVISGEGLEQVNFSKLVTLNESAAYLWKEVQDKEFTAETLTDLMLERYEVEREQAKKDAEALCRQWVEMGLAEE